MDSVPYNCQNKIVIYILALAKVEKSKMISYVTVS